MTRAVAPPRVDLDGRAVHGRVRGSSGPWRARRGRRAPFYSAGLVLVLVSVLVTVWLVSQAGHRVAVLEVARPLAAGQVLSEADVRSVAVSHDPALGLVRASQAGEVIGRPVVVPLVAGTLLTRSQVGDAAFPEPGKVVTSLALKPGQYPQGLQAGAKVAVFITTPPNTNDGQSAQGGSGDEGGARPVRVDAVVSGVDLAGDGQGSTVVTLELSADDAATVAGAPVGGVVLMQTAPGGA